MKTAIWAVLSAALFLSLGDFQTADSARKNKEKFTRLFNGKNFNGFYTFLPSQGKNKDPEGVFTIQDGAVHVTPKEFGYFATEKEYENYRLRFQVKWPLPKPQNNQRNAGCLYHFTGPDQVWPRSFECQVQEGNMGDFWLVDGTSITVDGKRYTSGNIPKKTNAEKPTGEWNTFEIVCDGDTCIHIINGVEVLRGTQASQQKGKILWQSEGAEVFYRNIEIMPLKKAKK